MSRLVTAPNRAREYETIYILRPDIDADSAERVGARLSEVIGREHGRLTKVENWGRRRLAYDIRKHRRGVYVYLKYLGTGKVVSEVERNLRLMDGVIKYQTILARNDVHVRKLEGLSQKNEVLAGDIPETVPVEMNGLHLQAPLLHGQKTGEQIQYSARRSQMPSSSRRYTLAS